MTSTHIWPLFILSFALTAAYSDVRWRKIPRYMTVAGVVIGLSFNWITGHIGEALLATTVAFALGLGLFSIGAIGGGDVKLMTALAAMMRLQSWAVAMNAAVWVAALIAVVQIIRCGAVRQTIRNIGQLLRHFATSGPRAHPTLNVRNEAALRSPFGIAVAAGTAFVTIQALHPLGW